MNGGPRSRGWVLWVLGAVFAAQLYFVQELLAIVILAAVVCCVFGLFIGGFLLLHRVSARALDWLEARMQPATARMNRSLAAGGDFSRRLLHRLRSQTAQ
jgi:hypothetical protein